MGRKAHHHYIPSSYLKGFTLEGEDTSQFWGVPINNDAPFSTNPKDACSKRDYYKINHDDELLIENWYAEEIEPKISIALKYIKKHERLPPKNEMQYLILLAATLYVRVPAFRQTLEAPRMRAQEIARSISEDIKVINMNEFDYTQTDIVKSEVRLIDGLIKSLSKKYYRLYIAKNSNFDVVTSDNPFILTHPDGDKLEYFGLNTKNIEICIPINRRSILVGCNEVTKEGVFEATDKVIGLINTNLKNSANRFFYSSKPSVALLDDNLNIYTHDISSNNRN